MVTAAERHQALFPQSANARELLLDPVDLPGFRLLLLDIALDLLAELSDLLHELGLLAGARGLAARQCARRG